ncbi:segment polarity protein dishevelled homolog DVL-3-like isoform X1 [Micropterus salmoides]|uniref:segment polarity protein dishevelled homolog DVL-3-like isoform X1 n=1 Tax=Micropterus salmoides TaxID=27706 RepID=UPI0018EDAC4C|nr:segment polarity protein dishevelled homolog DVL-3-like isoform X1 [Micropterus salmoides]XP_045930961.1 segment polarity protein dishevelled homolog DVL-3 isoform X1 [Micropterus dolomieu]
MGDSMAEDTRVIYHLEDQETPYLIRINVPAQRVTLADFKQVLNKPNLKFFFKAVDDDFGVVKEEISDDDARLPVVNGRVVCWLVSSETCQSDFRGSDVQSVATPTSLAPPPVERTGGIGDSRPPSFHAAALSGQDEVQGSEVKPEASPPQRGERESARDGRLNGHAHKPAQQNGAGPTGGGDSSSTQQSSQLETTSFCSSEEDSGGRFSQSTGQSSSSPRLVRRQRRRHRKPKTQRMERSVSFSSVTDSTMSLNVVTVTLNMERYNFLGISIVGQSNDRGDGGIYIGSIMKGGAVAADGRIEPGDMLLQVNDINFENMTNDDAVRVLREIVHKPGPVTLTVAKCWDPNPRGCFTLPRSEPVRPIDPAAWVSHTAAMTGRLLPHYGVHEDPHLTIHSDITAVVKAMANRESGLEVRDRMWLKITIPNAFIGSDVVDWLHRNVEGFTDRREARRYAGNLLKAGYIRHTVNKVTFSEQCYYVFGDLCGDLGLMSLLDHEEASIRDCDPLAPASGPQWPPAFPYQYPVPHPYSSPHPLHQLPAWGGGRGGGSRHSEGSHSSGSDCCDGQKEGGGGSGSEPTKQEVGASPDTKLAAQSPGEDGTQQPPTSGLRGDKDSEAFLPAPSPPRGQRRDIPPSRQSFSLAMGNPGDFFVDVM